MSAAKQRMLRWGIIGVMAGIAGCSTPDKWSAFEPDYPARIQKASGSSVELPEEVQPQVTASPANEPWLAEGSIELSIEQAAVLALRKNRDLRVEQLNPVITGTFEQIERGVFDPEFFAELESDEERVSETDRGTGGQFSVEGRDYEAVVGLRQRLPTGTDIEATVIQDRSISSRTPEQQSARLGLTVTQSLLQGFGPAVNMARVRQAEMETVASLYELRGFTEALLAEVEIAYWSYALAHEEIAIFERSLAIAEQERSDIEQRIEVGALPLNEAAAVRAEVALREQALIDARSLLEDRRLRLARLVNPDPAGSLNFQIDTTSKLQIDPEPVENMPERLKLAAQSRADLGEARLRMRMNELETVLTKNGLLPRLDLFIAYGRTGFSDTFGGSFDQIGGETYDLTGGVQFSHFLGNREARARHLAARASRQQAEEAVSNLEQIVQLDVLLAANELERARQQIAATAATRKYQEQTVLAEEERFDVGATTALQVAQARRDLLASRIAEVEAIVGYRIALVNLYLAEGSLLERRGIRIDPEENRLPQ